MFGPNGFKASMAAPQEYTPRTKLQKDKDFFGGLGVGSSVIAKAFQFPQISTATVPRFSKGAGVGAIVTKKAKDFSSFFKSKTKGLSANDRKGIRLEDEKRQKRNWKDSKYMERRNMDVDELPKVTAHQNLNLQSRAIGAVLGNAPKVGPLSRKDRLDKWKKEKEMEVKKAAQRTAASAPKPAASAIPASRSKPNLNAAPSTSRSNLNRGPGPISSSTSKLNPRPNAYKPPPSKTTGMSAANPNPPPDRRVTRAMTSGKSQAPPKPPVQSMSQLSLQARRGIPVKEAQGGETKVISKNAVKRIPPTSCSLANKDSVGGKKEDAGSAIIPEINPPRQELDGNGNHDPMETNIEISDAPVAHSAPPKKKVGPLDSCFTEFNGKLNEALQFLHTDTVYWTNKLEVSLDIPDNEKDEVSSHIGKLGLLIKSKLPQFAELLFHYLSNDGIDGPVLECDLAGWWDVAKIQIDQVTEASNKLKALESNGWILPPEETKLLPKKPTKRIQKSSSEGGTAARNKENAVKPKLAASGIRAFIDQKRKAAMRQSQPLPGQCEADVPLIDLVLPSSPPQAPSAAPPGPTEDRAKEEKIASVNSEDVTEVIQVQDVVREESNSASPRQSQQQLEVFESPLRILSSNSRTYVSRTPQPARVVALKVPNRRASLIMLKVRKSMGALAKPGLPFGQDTEQEPLRLPTPSKRLPWDHKDSLMNIACDESIIEEPTSDVQMQ